MNLIETNYIPRQYYQEKIEPFVKKPIIKVLTGQRRIGKSYLLLQIIDFVRKVYPTGNIVYVNKEDVTFDGIRNQIDLVQFVEGLLDKSVMNFIFIDEIQEIEEFEKGLRHLLLNPMNDIYCTGSNANLLSGELATLLAGRYIEIKVFGLSFQEFITFHQQPDPQGALKKYLLWGGLPFLRNIEPEDIFISEYLKSIVSTILYKDIIGRFNIRNPQFLENLVKYLAHNTGNIVSAKKISDYLKSQNINMSPQIVINYVHHLQQAMLISSVPRYDLTGKKIFDSNEKHYYQDWGLKNTITGFQNVQIQQIIENTIFIHLQRLGYSVTVGVIRDKEIDFVAERDGSRIYIQSCYIIANEDVQRREYGNLLTVDDNYPKYVISMDEFAPKNYNGVTHIHLQDFLQWNQ